MKPRFNHNPAATPILDKACKDWPDLPSRTLARKLFAENPLVFTDVEVVRHSIQYRRGRITSARHKKGVQGQFPSATTSEPINPFRLPPSDDKPFVPHEVKVDRDTKVLYLSDIHFPYHDLPALTEALRVGKKLDARLILLNGDVLDFHGISYFDRDPTAKRVRQEIELANQFLDALEDEFPKAKIIWKDGNHEDRLDRFIRDRAPELYDLKLITMPELLHLKQRGIDYVTEKRPIMLGKLPVIHGHEFRTPMMAPVNAARGLFLRAKNVCLQGHSHQTAEHNEPEIKGGLLTTWAVGCLCTLHPKYDPFAKWNHGLADIDLAANGDFEVHNRRIRNGKVLN